MMREIQKSRVGEECLTLSQMRTSQSAQQQQLDNFCQIAEPLIHWIVLRLVESRHVDRSLLTKMTIVDRRSETK